MPAKPLLKHLRDSINLLNKLKRNIITIRRDELIEELSEAIHQIELGMKEINKGSVKNDNRDS